MPAGKTGLRHKTGSPVPPVHATFSQLPRSMRYPIRGVTPAASYSFLLQPPGSLVSPAPWLFSFPSSCLKMLPGQIYKAPTGFRGVVRAAGEAPSWWGRGCGEGEGHGCLGSYTQTVGEGEVEGATE